MGSVPRFLQHSAATRRAAFSSMMMMSALIDSARKIAARSPAWSFAMPGEIAFGVCSTDIHAGRFDAQFRTAAGASSWSSSDHDKVAEWRRVRDRSPSICWTCAGVIAPERYDSIATASSTPRVTPPAWAARPCPMSSGMSIAIFTAGLPFDIVPLESSCYVLLDRACHARIRSKSARSSNALHPVCMKSSSAMTRGGRTPRCRFAPISSNLTFPESA